jgi:hypothetical protein
VDALHAQAHCLLRLCLGLAVAAATAACGVVAEVVAVRTCRKNSSMDSQGHAMKLYLEREV